MIAQALDYARSFRKEQPEKYGTLVLSVFSLTLCLSAFLLFFIQPFFSKMALPKLGGSPSVWSVAIVFFQGCLLLGYAYAHALTKWTSLRITIIIHGIVLGLAFLFLPIAIASGWNSPPNSGQAFWLFGLFTVSVGAPFFAVSANAPLLQAWFSRTGHPHAGDPYFLYGASNIGSFTSLILYIIAFEPLFTLSDQSQFWTIGYCILISMIISCGLLALKPAGAARGNSVKTHKTAMKHPQSSSVNDILWWILLAGIPSGLLVSVTAHISVDVASGPFLWVLPLSLFLLTFIIAFRQKVFIPVSILSRAMPWIGVLAAIGIFMSVILPIWLSILINLAVFFFCALFCHLLLVDRRPVASNLTAFYLWMSFGGFLGGGFVSLAAPYIFNWIAEYPLLVFAVILLSLSNSKSSRSWSQIFLTMSTATLFILFGYLALAFFEIVPTLQEIGNKPINIIIMASVIIGSMLLYIRSTTISFIILFFAFLAAIPGYKYFGIDFSERTFFGVITVNMDQTKKIRIMNNGTTIHGAMLIDDKNSGKRPEPLTYYHSSGGIALSLEAMRKRRGGTIGTGGIVGLGAGSMMCHTEPDESWTIFEIDKTVVEVALNPKLFSFMSKCAPKAKIILGDARLSIANIRNGAFDYLLIDAFSSDSIPIHLMTREALRLYFSKISADGILALHVSNRHMELTSVLAAIAASEGFSIRSGFFIPPKAVSDNPYISASKVVIMARNESHLESIATDSRWIIPQDNGVHPWTDDYSNVLGAILQKSRK